MCESAFGFLLWSCVFCALLIVLCEGGIYCTLGTFGVFVFLCFFRFRNLPNFSVALSVSVLYSLLQSSGFTDARKTKGVQEGTRVDNVITFVWI